MIKAIEFTLVAMWWTTLTGIVVYSMASVFIASILV